MKLKQEFTFAAAVLIALGCISMQANAETNAISTDEGGKEKVTRTTDPEPVQTKPGMASDQGTAERYNARPALHIEAIDKNTAYEPTNRHDGKVVSMTDDKLVYTDSEGKEQTLNLARTSKISLDNEPAKSTDLQPGMTVRVTSNRDAKQSATNVEAIRQNVDFAPDNRHEGKLVSITDKQLVMTGADGKEHTHTLASNVTVSKDGKVAKATDLKAGMRISVTSDNDFADSNRREGKLVSIVENKLSMTDSNGKAQTHTLPANVKMTVDGKVTQASELKPGMRIRVTTDRKAPHSPSYIEAIDRNESFSNSQKNDTSANNQNNRNATDKQTNNNAADGQDNDNTSISQVAR